MARTPNTSPQTVRLLTVMLQDPDSWHYGYQLSRAANLPPGTLYPMLARLAEQGFLEASWLQLEHPGRPPRHGYRLTAGGRELARERSGHRPLRPAPAPS